MSNFPVQFILIAFCVTLVTCDAQRINSLLRPDSDRSFDSENNIDKRLERYAFGLGRRAYTYTSGGAGVKRLPVYNFGLGKRARPYSFGLGKRAGYYDEDYSDMSANYDNDAAFNENIKRGRPYRYGLAKRSIGENDGVEKNSYPLYNFGLGKR